MDPEIALEVASVIIRQAGAQALRRFGQQHREVSKSSVFDIATEADREVEAYLVAALGEAFPLHHVVGEEGGHAGAPASADYHWYIDPIDGTSNYAASLPFFSVSMALCDREMRPLLGLVLNPVAEELFSARRGGGTMLNGAPVRVSQTTSLQNAILSCGYSRHPVHGAARNAPILRLLPQTRGLRWLGSSALELAWVACGRLDGYFEPGLNPWDFLGGLLLLREAGGRVSDYSGCEEALTGAELLASNGHLHEALLQELRPDAADQA